MKGRKAETSDGDEMERSVIRKNGKDLAIRETEGRRKRSERIKRIRKEKIQENETKHT